jgi:hypothetical protein
MSKCKPSQDQAKIFKLDILCGSEDGEVEVRAIEPVGSDEAVAQDTTVAESA